MKKIITIVTASFIGQYATAQFTYINPVPGSEMHSPQTTIILKSEEAIDQETVHNKYLAEIKGSLSGKHNWTARLSDDNKTVILSPETAFEYGETVSVEVNPELRTMAGRTLHGTSFQFKIRNEITPEQELQYRLSDQKIFFDEYGYDPGKPNEKMPLYNVPPFTVSVNNNPAPGSIFYNNHASTGMPDGFNSFLTIIENDGTVKWARDVGEDGHDFKISENGYLTYFVEDSRMWMIMDSNYYIIDSVQCKNGYELETNDHDIAMYTDGHVFLQAYDRQTIDMTAYGGVPNATVTGLIIQELDQNRDVVFEWRSWDHFLFTDANNYTPLTNALVDYVHGNTVERDFDGNVLISCRNLDELTKIDHQTGNIIWRMGGENNQFTFVNDNIPQHFSSQHDLRRLPNGHITIYNNGNYLIPTISSAKEYSLDEANKVATLVWYYEHPDVSGVHVYGGATGNAQRLSNGNTLIDWGLTPSVPGMPTLTEVDANKNIVWEMAFDSFTEKTYRAHKYEWNPCSRPTPSLVVVKKIKTTTAKIDWEVATGAVTYDVQFRKLGTTSWKKKNTSLTYLNLAQLIPGQSYEYRVRSHCASNKVSAWTPLDTFKTHPLRLSQVDEDVLSAEVYPNPVTDVMQLTFSLNHDDAVTIFIIDLEGKTISKSTQQRLAGVNNCSLEVSSLPVGFYFVEIKTSEGSMLKKFIKQ